MNVMEGSEAIARAVALARPGVIAAYPITPQTHVVESLASMVARGTLHAEFMTAESEHSAASMVLGASATGVRTYTATSSQGLLYMAEVVFDIAGMRLPIVMTVANRALSGPLSIWNDHQDSMAMRDSGWIQLFAQTAQEAHDLHLVAYRIAEDRRVQLPVMMCVDGFVLTHAYEPVDLLQQEQVDLFLPPFAPDATLDPARPITFGAYADPSVYTEARFAVHEAHAVAGVVLGEALDAFAALTGRRYAPDFDLYRAEDASIVLVAMGTAAQTARVAIDRLRAEGVAAGLLALRTFRPFPAEQVRAALQRATRVVVLDRSISAGAAGPLAGEIKAALLPSVHVPAIVSVIAGLGGRDVSVETLRTAICSTEDRWVDLQREEVPT